MQTDLEYGQAILSKMAKYPERFMKAQRMQEAIPCVKELDLDRIEDHRRKLETFSRELNAYAVATGAVIASYQRIIDDAEHDCSKIQTMINGASSNVNPARIEILKTNIVITMQLVVAIKQQQGVLQLQMKTVEESRRAIALARTQINAAQIIRLNRELMQRDQKIHQKNSGRL